MFYPDGIKKGDAVGIIAPAGPVENVNEALQAVEQMGFCPVAGESLKKRQGYLAGTDKERAQDINRMFANKEITAVFAARGGYGCQRLMNLLDFRVIKNNPKIFAGYSDITVLLNAINKKCGYITFHAPMFATEFAKGTDDYTVNSFLQFMYNPCSSGAIVNPKGSEFMVIKDGYAKGRIVGGNLTLVVSSIGTWYEPDLRNSILFIEEVGESPYKIDRMITQLVNSGRMASVQGIILGSFTDCEEKDKVNMVTLHEVLTERLSGLGIPVLCGLSAGHSLPSATIPIGAMGEIKEGKLYIL